MAAYPTTKLKKIAYDSPSGSINIGKWVPPFREVEGGFGFYGVLAEDSKTGQLQCHICGEWHEMLSAHAYPKHGLNTVEYQECFGLLRGTVLRTIRMRKLHSKVMTTLRKKYPWKCNRKFEKGNKEAGNRKGTEKAVESANRYGVCDLQMADKIIRLAAKLGKTPTLVEVLDEYGQGTVSVLYARYGSYIDYVRSLGMVANFSNFNPKYSKEYFVDKGVNEARLGNVVAVKKIFNESEQRNLYKYFPSWGVWKEEVNKRLGIV